MKSLFLSAAFFLPIMISPTVLGQNKPFIFEMYERFVLTDAVSSKCLTLNSGDRALFQSNFQLVTALALEEVKLRRPEIQSEEALRLLERSSRQLKVSAEKAVVKQGCEGKLARDSEKYFKILIKWKPLD